MSAATFSADADNKDEEDVVEVLDAMGPLRAPVSVQFNNVECSWKETLYPFVRGLTETKADKSLHW